MTKNKTATYFIAAILAMLLSSGCAKMFACTTDASYIITADTTEVHYSSCKEQVGLDADIDPVTKKLHVKVDKSTTQDAVTAAALQLNLQLLKMLEAAQKGAAMGAGVPVK